MLRDALTNAPFVGFTGTPTEKTDASSARTGCEERPAFTFLGICA